MFCVNLKIISYPLVLASTAVSFYLYGTLTECAVNTTEYRLLISTFCVMRNDNSIFFTSFNSDQRM